MCTAQVPIVLPPCGVPGFNIDLLLLLPLALLQVWYTASTAAAGRSGSVRSSIKAHAGPAKGKLRIAGLVIAGVPPQLDNAAPTASIAGQDVALAATYDAVTGVVRIENIDMEVGQPFELTWRI
jgi:hypothetical protein